MRPQQDPACRTGEEQPQHHHGNLPSPAGFLSLNVFYQQQHRVSLCRSTCRSIDVHILYPATSPRLPSLFESSRFSDSSGQDSSGEMEQHPAAMGVDQERPAFSLTDAASRDHTHTPSQETFPFMSLPVELRLKIYGYLLPARTHTIATQIPYNGYFYNSSTVPQHSAQSFYPFGRNPPSKNNLTTYKVLNTNFRSQFPAPSIYPEIFRTCKKIKEEAEPVLYSTPDTVFDFGIHLEALQAFWGDRSETARRAARNLRVAREIPCLEAREVAVASGEAADPAWARACGYLKNELPNLRTLDLTVWSSSGSVSSFPSSSAAAAAAAAAALPTSIGAGNRDEDARVAREEARRWREWEWTHDLLQMEALRMATVTWWGFRSMKGESGESPFDSWLAGRMVADKLVKDRMVTEGVVHEGHIVLAGISA